MAAKLAAGFLDAEGEPAGCSTICWIGVLNGGGFSVVYIGGAFGLIIVRLDEVHLRALASFFYYL